MDVHWLMAIAGSVALLGVFGIAAVVMLLVQRLTESRVRLDSLADDVRELKENQQAIWQALYSRGAIAAANKGLGQMQSPLTITQAAKEMFPDELAHDLQEFYEAVPKPITDSTFGLMIEKRSDLRERITHDVCLKYGIDSLECLAIAVEVAKSSEVLSV